MNPNEIVKNIDQELYDNNEDFNDWDFMPNPIPNTTLDYIQKFKRYTETENLNGQK